jgi:hypothetical protein
MGPGPILFLTGNSAGDRKRPIQKEGGLNEREKI